MGKRFRDDYEDEDDYHDRKRNKFSEKEMRRQAAKRKQQGRDEYFQPTENYDD